MLSSSKKENTPGRCAQELDNDAVDIPGMFDNDCKHWDTPSHDDDNVGKGESRASAKFQLPLLQQLEIRLKF